MAAGDAIHLEELEVRRRDAVAAARGRVWSLVAAACAGLAVAHHAAAVAVLVKPLAWASLAVVAAVAAAWCGARGRERAMRSLAVAAAALLAGAWVLVRVHTLPADHASRVLSPGVVRVEGVVTASPTPAPPPSGALAAFAVRAPSSMMRVRCAGAETPSGRARASGELLVLVTGEAPAVRAGDSVAVTGVFEPVEGPRNPGESDGRLWAAQRGRAGVLRVSSASLVTPVPSFHGALGDARFALARAQESMRARAEGIVDRASGGLDPSSRALLRGLLLGRAEHGGDLQESFARLGLSHALSISGFHLAVIGAAALWLVRLTGDRGGWEALAVAALVLAYALVVPPGSPIARSAAMTITLLIGASLGRRHDPLCVLGWATLGLLAWRPLDLWSLGFQLSVGLTAVLLWARDGALALFAGVWVRGVQSDSPRPIGWLWRACRGAAASGAMCWLVSAPLIAHATGLVSVIGLAATLVTAPIIVALLWAGFCVLLAGAAVPGVADASAAVLGALADACLAVTARLDGLSFSSVRVPPVPALWAWCATALAALWVRFGPDLRAATWWKRTGRWLAGVAVLAAWLAGSWSLRPTPTLRIDALSVGEGTCMIVRAGDECVLWDCRATGARTVLPGVAAAARELGAWRVPRVIISHPDMDHFAGLPEIIEPLGVREVLVPRRFIGGATGRNAPGALLAMLEQRGVAVRVLEAGDVLRIGHARATVVSPPGDAPYGADNDHSLVLLVEAPTSAAEPARLLLTGDVGPEAVRAIADAPIPRPDAIELPHHGSFNDAADAWLKALAPRVVVQSASDRRGGERRWDDLRSRTESWLNTAERGWCSVEWERDGSITTRSIR